MVIPQNPRQILVLNRLHPPNRHILEDFIENNCLYDLVSQARYTYIFEAQKIFSRPAPPSWTPLIEIFTIRINKKINEEGK